MVFAVAIYLFGAADLGRAMLATFPAVLTGLAFAAPITAFAGNLEHDQALASLFRFGIVPMFLFSGTFFPVEQIPNWLEPLVYVIPLWHGVELTRSVALGTSTTLHPAVHVAALVGVAAVGFFLAVKAFEKRLIK